MYKRQIEINARLSRSSALASKATGYPLAYLATKVALGYTLDELNNQVTGVTTACFEPSLDYLVIKFPRWDLKKFERVSRRIGTQMKSVGEVMGIGRTFEEALQKAIRMLDIGKKGLTDNIDDIKTIEKCEEELRHPTDEILFNVMHALKAGMSIERINQITSIDVWYLDKIKNIISTYEELQKEKKNIPRELLLNSKKLGFADTQIALATEKSENDIRNIRKKESITPYTRQIDTLGAEWPAKTNYLYTSYGANKDDVSDTTVSYTHLTLPTNREV